MRANSTNSQGDRSFLSSTAPPRFRSVASSTGYSPFGTSLFALRDSALSVAADAYAEHLEKKGVRRGRWCHY